ncbi:hypothetical protein PR202_gb21429 [Eleusine coracana subsp. coracana]|uniref:Uncharacterized protein n=1 Tax=Eleusine coracana subsp. coracana TaxID=191504 RepID=A0AAV5FDX6_ELECO|nr:hypothetical protein PR202_gb21429 [Eleusine coracana subsp. coracana]
MGLSRRFLNLIVDHRIPGSRSLSGIDLTHQDFFNTTPTRPPHGDGSEPDVLRIPPRSSSCPRGRKMRRGRRAEAAMNMERVCFPSPMFNFQAATMTSRWSINCFPLAGSEVLCVDQSQRAFLFDLDALHVVTVPDICKLVQYPISVFIPSGSNDMDGRDDSGGGSLFIMSRIPEQESTECTGNSDQFAAFVYRKNTKTSSCLPLPPPPFIRDPKYWPTWRPSISSYTVLGDGSEICISVDNAGTYCFDTVRHTWRHVGDWTLPFQGRVEYVPELKLWFGFSATNGHFAVADLSAVEDSQPQLMRTWMELTPLKGWWNTWNPHFVNLGSGKFCIARYYHTETIGGFYGDQVLEHHFTVLSGVEIATCARDDNSKCSGSDISSVSQVGLQMNKYKTKIYASKDGSLIKLVF